MLDHTLSYLHIVLTGVRIYTSCTRTFSCATPPPSTLICDLFLSLSLSLYSLFSLSRYFLHVTGCVWMLLNEMQEQRLSTWATERLLAGQSWRIQYSAAIYCAGLLMFGEDVGPTTVRWEGAEERERKRYRRESGTTIGGIVRRKRIGEERGETCRSVRWNMLVEVCQRQEFHL